MKETGKLKRILALVVAFALCFSIVPWQVLAADTATYTKISSAEELTTGSYVMVASNGYAPGVLDGTWITAVDFTTLSGDTISDAQGAVWTITVGDDGVTLTDSNGVSIAPKSGDTNGISSGSYSWAVACTDGTFTFSGQGSDTTILASNTGSENKFRAYKTSTVSKNPNGYPSTFTLYKLDEAAGEEPSEDPTEETTQETTVPEETTPAAALADGTYVIWESTNSKAAVSLTGNYGYLQVVDVALADGTLSGYGETAAFTFAATGNGTYTITDSNGKYLYMTGTYNSFNVSATLPESGAEWNVTVNEDGTVKLQNALMGKYVSYDTTYNSFGAYAEPSNTQLDDLTLTAYTVQETTPDETEPEETEPEETEPEETAGSTATLVTDVTSLAAGDQIIIVATDSDVAMSTNQKTNNRGEAAVTKSEDGTVVTYTEDAQVITLEAGTVDGTWAFNVGSGYLYAASSSANHLKTESTLSANSSWSVEIADGVATILAQGENTRNWMRYNSTSALFACYASGQQDISIYKLSSGEEEEEEQTSALTSGKYVIWAPAYNMALSSSYNGYYNAGVEVAETDGVLSGYTAAEIWDVTVNEDGTITLASGGQNLAMAASYSSLTLGEVNDQWALEDAGDGLYYVKNTVRGAYIEWYASKSNWSGYAYINEGTEGMFALKFTPVEEEVTGVADGKYVIWASAYGKALSSSYNGYYNTGVDVALEGDTLTGYTAAEIWTVTNNEDGTISISYGGKNLAMAASFSSLTLGEVNDKWVLEDAGNGQWYVKNTVRGAYIEWYATNNNWSGYAYINSGSEGMFALTFTPVDQAYATDPTVVEDIAQWSGAYSEEAAAQLNAWGDKYVAGDKLDSEAILTVVAKGTQISPYYLPGSNGYMGGTGIGASDGDYIQMAVSTAGWGDMTLAFRMRSTKTAPGEFQLCYSTDGGATWTNFTSGSYAYAYTQYTSDGSYPVSATGSIADGVARTSLAATYYVSFAFDVPSGAENCDNLLIRLIPGETLANGTTGTASATGTIRMDSVVLSGSPIVDDSITSYVAVTPNGDEDQPVGTLLTMTSEDGATIYYRVNGGEWKTYDPENKPALDTLPCDIEAYAVCEGKAESVTLLYHYAAGTVATVKMTPNGGGVYIPAGGSETIELTCATEDAVIYYMTSADGEVWPEEWTEYAEPIVLEDGFDKLVVKAYAAKAGYNDGSQVVRTFTERETSSYTLYFGQLHSHTNISDGSGSIEEAYAHAYEVANLDFLAVTDHSNSFDNTNGVLAEDASLISTEWAAAKAAAEAITDETFVGLYGYEMTWSNGLGHMNTFNTPGFQSRTQSDYTTYSTALQNYYNTLTTVNDSISQFNHPGTTFGDFSDFAHYTEEYDALITLIEVGNGEGEIGSSGYFPSYEYYTRALDKGWHVAPTNNQDNHKGLWGDANTGRSVVLADSLTEEGIYDALRNYRVYATEDNDLNIYYTLNGQVMGSTVEVTAGEQITLTVALSDATDATIGKVEVIVNGGLTAASAYVDGSSDTVTFTLDNNYSYYYIKVTQADGDIAVTAPVWTGEVEACGISSFETDAALPVQDQEMNLSLSLYNNENVDLIIDSIVFTIDDEVIHTAYGVDKVGALDTVTYSFPYSHSGLGQTEIYATVTGTLNGVEKVYKEKLSLTFVTPDMVTRVVVDGTHYNDYVTGYYGGNMSNLTAIAAESQIEVNVVTDQITEAILETCDLLIISAPARNSGTANAGDYVAKPFEDEFIALVVDYVANGGTVVVCGLADYQDYKAESTDYHTANQLNKLLSSIGSTMRINDDEAYDEENNGGQAYRLYPTTYNTESQWTEGVAEGQQYSQYSGCTVDVGEGTWLVRGFDTTYSIDSDKDGLGGVEKGEAVFLAVEETPYGGNIFVAGGVFVSDFEVKAELDNIWDLPYANRTIIENIMGAVRTELPLSTIAEVRAADMDEVFRIRGYVTAGTSNENTTFFDAIYVQDETGGITVFPFSVSGVEIGTAIEIVGYVDEYQGDKEIQIMSYTILDAEPYVYAPEKMSNADAMNYDVNGGKLIQVEGEVVEVLYSGENGVAQFVVKDENGDLAKVFIDGYILSGTTGENDLAEIVKVGNTVSAVGLLYMHPEGDSEVSVAVLRVRDCDEVLLIKAAAPEEEDPTDPSETTEATEPSESTETTETSDTTATTKPSTGSNAPTGDTGIVVQMTLMVSALLILAVLMLKRKQFLAE